MGHRKRGEKSCRMEDFRENWAHQIGRFSCLEIGKIASTVGWYTGKTPKSGSNGEND